MKVVAVPYVVCEVHLGCIEDRQWSQRSEICSCFILHYFTDLYSVAHHRTSLTMTGSIPWSLESKFTNNPFNNEVLGQARGYVWGEGFSTADQHWLNVPSYIIWLLIGSQKMAGTPLMQIWSRSTGWSEISFIKVLCWHFWPLFKIMYFNYVICSAA